MQEAWADQLLEQDCMEERFPPSSPKKTPHNQVKAQGRHDISLRKGIVWRQKEEIPEHMKMEENFQIRRRP